MTVAKSIRDNAGKLQNPNDEFPRPSTVRETGERQRVGVATLEAEQTVTLEKTLERKVVIDEYGFCSLDASTHLRFIMSPDVLECIDYLARITRTDRSKALMATIVGEEIDPNAPISIEARVVEDFKPTIGQRDPLTFVVTIEGRRFGVQLMSRQDLQAVSDPEAITTMVRPGSEMGH
jgi:hypothetical protein